LLFGPPRQDSQQIQPQLLQSYDQRQSQAQITGHAAITLHDLGAAAGAG